ncbi:MAG: hypothetical protein FWC39_07700 [Bacteroidetes bacterium]|nr:hypothetical protein [Bacteroidota bacterium]
MSIIQLSVIQVSPAKTAGRFITKLQHKIEASVNADGLPISGNQVYSIMLPVQQPVGKELTIDLDNYNIIDSEYLPKGNDKPVPLKWLSPKNEQKIVDDKTLLKVRFVCLANSFKEGGRCVAGIMLDENNNPILENGNPKWVRPVCNTEHGEVPTHLAVNINLLDIIEIKVLSYPNLNSYQSENALFEGNSLCVTGKYDKTKLHVLYDSNRLIFNNSPKVISEDHIKKQNRSLMFVKITDFEAYQITYEDDSKPKTRMKFTYYGNQYDLPVTDPVFLQKYQSNPEFVKDYSRIDITLSIGIVHEGWYYKLIAGIILF